jgi:hypothetical protein
MNLYKTQCTFKFCLHRFSFFTPHHPIEKNNIKISLLQFKLSLMTNFQWYLRTNRFHLVSILKNTNHSKHRAKKRSRRKWHDSFFPLSLSSLWHNVDIAASMRYFLYSWICLHTVRVQFSPSSSFERKRTARKSK